MRQCYYILRQYYILRRLLLHFALVLHFATIITFCGVTKFKGGEILAHLNENYPNLCLLGETRLYLQHTRKIMNYTNLINSVYNLKWDLRKQT